MLVLEPLPGCLIKVSTCTSTIQGFGPWVFLILPCPTLYFDNAGCLQPNVDNRPVNMSNADSRTSSLINSNGSSASCPWEILQQGQVIQSVAHGTGLGGNKCCTSSFTLSHYGRQAYPRILGSLSDPLVEHLL